MAKRPISITSVEWRGRLLFLCLLIVLLGSFFVISRSIPKLEEEEREVLLRFPPSSVSHLKTQRDTLLLIAQTHPGFVLSGLCLLYISMQTFAIPGTLSLSLLSGALYGVVKGLLLVSVVSTVGSASCYLGSQAVGKSLAFKLWPAKVQQFRGEVDRRRSDLLSYIIFLRVTPVLPNTFINIACPIVQVPLVPFIAGTFIGCLPNNFIAVNAGSRLSTLQSFKELYDVRQLLTGIAIGCAALVPVFLRRSSKFANKAY